MKLTKLRDYNASLLQTVQFKDYCPNGIQIEGRDEVLRIATAVTASQQVVDEAIAWGADAIIVHHGYFWRNEDACIVGIKKRRIAQLLKNDVSLLAYHLPLDAHRELGNNAQLGQMLGLTEVRRFADQDIACFGIVDVPLTLSQFAERVSGSLQHTPRFIGNADSIIRNVAWCSGGAQGYFEAAIAQGADVFLTGEISEQSFHLANESGVAFMAAGHHATERSGVQALGVHLACKFNLQHRFFDQDNPV